MGQMGQKAQLDRENQVDPLETKKCNTKNLTKSAKFFDVICIEYLQL